MISGRTFILPRDLFMQNFGKTVDLNKLYLGDGCELRLGLFQSVVLGDELFLNVDVNHKALVKRYPSFLDLLSDFAKDFRLPGNYLNNPLPGYVQDGLHKHLSGLDICYTQPGTHIKSVRKFIGIESRPSEVSFNHDGVQTTVQDYFIKRGTNIEYPNLPCIKLGSRDKHITVPFEFCSIYEQVKLSFYHF